MPRPLRRPAGYAPFAAIFALAGACSAASPSANPLLEPSPLYLHYPAFDRIKEPDFREAFNAGMARQAAELEAIAMNPQAASFENTIVALERSGELLYRVKKTFDLLTQANTNPEHGAIDKEMAPRLAASRDAKYMNAALFERIEDLYKRRAALGLDAESLRLLERYHVDFTRAGAGLDDAGKAKLREVNAQLADANTEFDQSLLQANADGVVFVDRESDLEGFSPARISAAAVAARARHQEGRWAIPLQRPTSQDALSSLANRALRERIYKASIARGAGGPDDTSATVVRLAKLRARKAKLMGFPDWASYALGDVTAGSPAAVNRMLAQVDPASIGNMKSEAAELQKAIDEDCAARRQPSFKLQPWDWSYYAERVRRQRFALDEEAVKPFFELDQVLHEGIFYAAHELYGLSFKERKDLPVYDPDVRVFEVFDDHGESMALILFDFFARANKQGGAWMDEYVTQSRLTGYKPVVANHLNLPKPDAGQPALMNFDEVNTAFHEFGHALHGMLSNVQYPMFGGTIGSPPDFGEFPSQFNEMWAHDPKVLAHMARHYKTGEPLPAALLDKVLAARKFDEAFITGEFLEAIIIDQAWYQIPESRIPAPGEIARFESEALRRAGMEFAPVPPRYHSTYFAHIFGASAGYEAQYYGYLWSDVMAKDAEYWMNAHGGLDRANGDFMRAKVLSRGFSKDPKRLFLDFYGAEPDVRPLLDARGLKVMLPACK